MMDSRYYFKSVEILNIFMAFVYLSTRTAYTTEIIKTFVVCIMKVSVVSDQMFTVCGEHVGSVFNVIDNC